MLSACHSQPRLRVKGVRATPSECQNAPSGSVLPPLYTRPARPGTGREGRFRTFKSRCKPLHARTDAQTPCSLALPPLRHRPLVRLRRPTSSAHMLRPYPACASHETAAHCTAGVSDPPMGLRKALTQSCRQGHRRLRGSLEPAHFPPDASMESSRGRSTRAGRTGRGRTHVRRPPQRRLELPSCSSHANSAHAIARQGRDNLIHLFRLPASHTGSDRSQDGRPAVDIGAATAVPSPSQPSPGFDEPAWTIDVNAMSFCRMHVLSLAARPSRDLKGKARADPAAGETEPIREEAMIAVPSLTRDDLVSFSLPVYSTPHTLLTPGLR